MCVCVCECVCECVCVCVCVCVCAYTRKGKRFVYFLNRLRDNTEISAFLLALVGWLNVWCVYTVS